MVKVLGKRQLTDGQSGSFLNKTGNETAVLREDRHLSCYFWPESGVGQCRVYQQIYTISNQLSAFFDFNLGVFLVGSPPPFVPIINRNYL